MFEKSRFTCVWWLSLSSLVKAKVTCACLRILFKKLQGLAKQWRYLSQKTELPDLTLGSQFPHMENVHRDSQQPGYMRIEWDGAFGESTHEAGGVESESESLYLVLFTLELSTKSHTLLR